MISATEFERFWSHVDTSNPDGCWPWRMRSTDCYGAMTRDDGTIVRAHRFAWMMVHGPIPPGLQVLHDCDFKPCVRPDHLHAGTPSQNAKEAWERIPTLLASRTKRLTLHSMGIALPRPIYDLLKAQAAKERRTINGEVIMALEMWARLKDPNSLHPVNQRPKP